jgi:hypothetical protein
MSRNLLFVATILLSAVHSSASALGYFSRSCPISEIPPNLRASAIALFEVIGTAPAGKLIPIIGMVESEQDNYYVLESITTDWLEARYYLYAENNVYQRECSTVSNCTTPLLEAFTITDQVMSTSKFDIFFHNRKLLYSARAGEPEIVKYYLPFEKRSADAFRQSPVVVGNHYYFDPQTKKQVFLGTSTAMNCNLGAFGFEYQ